MRRRVEQCAPRRSRRDRDKDRCCPLQDQRIAESGAGRKVFTVLQKLNRFVEARCERLVHVQGQCRVSRAKNHNRLIASSEGAKVALTVVDAQLQGPPQGFLGADLKGRRERVSGQGLHVRHRNRQGEISKLREQLVQTAGGLDLCKIIALGSG